MNDRSDLELFVTDWLRAGAPPRAPERVLTTSLDRVAGVGQDRPLGGRRFDEWIGHSPRLRWTLVLVVLAAALLGAIAGVGALLRDSRVTPPGVVNGWVAYAQHSPLGNQDARNTPMNIFLVRQGTKPHRIAGTDHDLIRAVCPTFSPDGRRLAYAESTNTSGVVNNSYGWAGRAVVIMTVDAAGLPAEPLARIPVSPDGGDPCPEWSSDGRYLAFLTGDPADLAIARADGSATVKMVGDAKALEPRWFAWSPDGALIATAGPSGIWLVPTDGGPPRRVHSSNTEGDIAWSPDGSRIASIDGNPGLASSVRVIRLDGTTEDLGSGFGAVWSPDGNRIAYERGVDPGTDIPSKIIVANPDGSDQHEIALPSLGVGAIYTSSGIVWSPDRSRLLFVSGGELLISVSASGDPAPVVFATEPGGISDAGLSWQPVHP